MPFFAFPQCARAPRAAVLACALALGFLPGCGGGDPAPETATRMLLLGQADATAPVAGAPVRTEAFRGGLALAPVGSERTAATGHFAAQVDPSTTEVRVVVQAAPATTLSAYVPGVEPHTTAVHVNAVTTLVDRVRMAGGLPADEAQARVAAYLGLPADASTQRSYADRVAFSHLALQEAQEASGMPWDVFVDSLRAQLLADPSARRPFQDARREPAWDDPPLLQSAPFAGDLVAAAAKAAFGKAAGAAMGSVLTDLGIGADAQVMAQFAQINARLTALQNAIAAQSNLIAEAMVQDRVHAMKNHVDQVVTANHYLQTILTQTGDSRALAIEMFNDSVRLLMNNQEVFASALEGSVAMRPMAELLVNHQWNDQTQKFYAWKHQEKILTVLDYYDAMNGSMYLLYANYLRGQEAALNKDYSGMLALLEGKLERQRASYRKHWPERLPNEKTFIGKQHKVVYSGVVGYGLGDERLQHLREFRRADPAHNWAMPTTKHYEAQHGIGDATGQRLTQYLYRDFLDFAKGRNQPIGEAVVDAGAPAMFAGKGDKAIFLTNEDVREHGSGPHIGYVVFDLANASQRSYRAMRPRKIVGVDDMGYDLAAPVPGKRHYLYGRELTAEDRIRWKIPSPY